ncbi:MAG TPA: DUF2079 domain-containing protein [Acidimicrobiales bacterium]|nr:DUF2079 domain-containing protein [Acidimicrobiales bacterium]
MRSETDTDAGVAASVTTDPGLVEGSSSDPGDGAGGAPPSGSAAPDELDTPADLPSGRPLLARRLLARPLLARHLRVPTASEVRAAVVGLCWLIVLGQLVGLMLWSWHLLDLANVSWDFAIYYQPWYLVAHLHLLPRNTFQGGFVFMRNDGELIVYVLAPLYWLFPNHQLGYLWLQDLAVAGVTATCLRLVGDALPWRICAPRREQAVAGFARLFVVLVVVANPFVYWVASFDIHMEVFGACFALLTLRAALRERRPSTAVWALLTALCGAASVVYLVGVGITAAIVLTWRHRARLRRAALLAAGWPLALSVIGVIWLGVLGAAHATVGSPAAGYAYLAGGTGSPSLLRAGIGALGHPSLAISVIESHGWNLWANTSPDGFVGLFTPAFFLAAPALLANNLLRSQAFSYPSFQNFVVYGSVALGTVAVVATLLRRRWLWALGLVLAAAVLYNAAGWSNAWFSLTADEWTHMSPDSAAVVKQIAHEAKAGDEVVASQGYLGIFAGRQQVYSFSGPLVVPIRSRTVWFVLSPTQGLQVATHAETYEAIDRIVHLPGVQTIEAGDNDIWVYRWHPPAGVRSLSLGEPGAAFPIWMVPGGNAAAITEGPAAGWGVASIDTDQLGPAGGYLFTADFFQLPAGRYEAEVRYQSDVPVTPEVFDDNDSKIIAGPPSGIEALHPRVVRMYFSIGAPRVVPAPLAGSGWYRDEPIPTIKLATVSVQIWMPPNALVRAWWTAIRPVPARGS